MASLNKYQDFVQQLLTGVHNFTSAGATIKTVIHTDAPTLASDDELADLTQITGTGYTSGGEDMQNDMTETGGTATVTGVDQTWTAGAADWSSSARYITDYNDSVTGKKVCWSYDYGTTFLVGNGESFTVDRGASVITVS